MACGKKSEATGEPGSTLDLSAGARVIVAEHGFTPSSLILQKGAAGSTVPVTFVRTTETTCAKEVVLPDVGIKKELPLNTPVTIDVPADAARTLTFQCGMAMYKGVLIVR
ncbi:MAG: cupredoxin domain-containing protein [Myxococcota bacterium]|nr:cupredoxin domain-containing protein [Myxococcota bacterium]